MFFKVQNSGEELKGIYVYYDLARCFLEVQIQTALS
jgi:hypothetical protein